MHAPPFAVVLPVCALALSALSCDAGTGGTPAAFAVPLPAPVLAARTVDRDALDVAVTVNGVEAAVTRDADGGASASRTVPAGEELLVEITWVDRSGRRAVPLFALSSRVGPVSGDAAVTIEEEYEALDADGDGRSNFDELESGEDPFPTSGTLFDGRDAPQAVRIPRLDPGLAPPDIDGLYDEDGVWNNARFVEADGSDFLHIDNLLIDRGAEAGDGEPMYRWFAMHDGEFLYLSVLFEGARDEESGEPRDEREYTPVHDSARFFEDDGLNLFFDGDGSARSTLDGVDDVYLQIPQVTPSGGGGEGVVARRPFALEPEAPVPGLEYRSCVCRSGASSWEVKIPLSLIGVEVGRPFGFEVQIDQDLDGDGREARWGWANPSIGSPMRDADFRFESPRSNGMIVLTEETKAGDASAPATVPAAEPTREPEPEPAPDPVAAPNPSRSGALVTRHAGRCVDVSGGLQEDGTNVRQWDCLGTDNQRFDVVEAGEGFVQLKARYSGLCLDVSDFSMEDGGNVVQFACNRGSANQQFELTSPDGDGWFGIVARHSGLCLDVEGFSTEAGANVQQYRCEGSANQQFRFE